MNDKEKLEKLEQRIKTLEGVLITFLSENFPGIVGGRSWCAEAIKVIEDGRPVALRDKIKKMVGL